MTKNIAIIGGGTVALYFLKAFVAMANSGMTLDIFEANENVAIGMPYNPKWTNTEHTVNIACKELPLLLEEPHDWLMRQSDALLRQFGISREEISPLLVLPRILFGLYQESQFFALLESARKKALMVSVHTNCRVEEIKDISLIGKTRVTTTDFSFDFDTVIIATGHEWPKQKEESIAGYYDSPFPLKKLNKVFNHRVGLLGSSLSAVDAIKTLAKNHGQFQYQGKDVVYIPNPGTENFKIIMHSRRGLLPSIRYHLEHPRIRIYENISKEEIERNVIENSGFLSLDYVFEKSYKDIIAEKDPVLYERIRNMSLEQFVNFYYKEEGIHSTRPFENFRKQLQQSRISEIQEQPIYWKEAIEDTIYTLNFHAKSLSAEDMIRLRNYLMPLYYHAVIFMPYDSCEEILALYDAGKLDIIAIGHESSVETNKNISGATVRYINKNGEKNSTHFLTFIDCRGQRQLSFESFPFKDLIWEGAVAPARLQFVSGDVMREVLPAGCLVEEMSGTRFLKLPGVAFNNAFQVINTNDEVNPRIYIIAGPHIKGLNPDLSGIPFCDDSARIIMESIRDERR